MQPILLINAVGLTPRLLAHAPRLSSIAHQGWMSPLREVTPAVTCSAQASLLTGQHVDHHGIVANGWLFRDTAEIRFWQQSNHLLLAEPLYTTAKRRAEKSGKKFKSAKLFWWFNQGANVDISVTPKPWYGVDGNKVFGITSTPPALSHHLEQKLGPFPFHTFWGPLAGLPCTQWIAKCAAEILQSEKPDLTLVYLPHLDYDPQRFGPSGTNMPQCVAQLDNACAPLLDSAKQIGAQVWIVSEYGHCDVNQPLYPNRILRNANLLTVRNGPFGEQLDTFASRAFAVCDHQVAHIYVKDPKDIDQVQDLLSPIAASTLSGATRSQIHLNHPRSGEIILLAKPLQWFAYPFWLNDHSAPDYARTVAIHHKPGFDPCEMFFDPHLSAPKLKVAWKLLQKKLGFRTKLNVIPLDATIVHGSHGLPADNPLDRPILIGHGTQPQDPHTCDVRDMLLAALGLPEE